MPECYFRFKAMVYLTKRLLTILIDGENGYLSPDVSAMVLTRNLYILDKQPSGPKPLYFVELLLRKYGHLNQNQNK